MTGFPLITVRDLVKTFRVVKKDPGIWGAIRGLVKAEVSTLRAVDEERWV